MTDLEEDFEDEALEEFYDRDHIAEMPDANPKQYDFVETSLYTEVHENFEDLVEDKIFKYKYRQNADDLDTYGRRQKRMMSRFFERARVRDRSIETNLDELYAKNEKTFSVAALAIDTQNFEDISQGGTAAIREYMAKEGVQQYRDYYEDDPEEQGFFEYLDNLPNRDRIRFIEIFEDFTLEQGERGGYTSIPKREFNPELSAFSNILLDLQDFRDRVKPLANDLARFDASRRYQRNNVNEMAAEGKDYLAQLAEGRADEAADTVEEGYSSMEIAAESGAEDAASPDLEAAAEQNEAEDGSEKKDE